MGPAFLRVSKRCSLSDSHVDRRQIRSQFRASTTQHEEEHDSGRSGGKQTMARAKRDVSLGSRSKRRALVFKHVASKSKRKRTPRQYAHPQEST